jgi:polyketide cyclase/dehydrase/lipid transport protein
MKPYSVSVSTTVAAPLEEVHELLDDLSAHRQWTDHFLVDWELVGDPHGVGAKARFRAKGAGPNARGEIEVISSTPTQIVEEGRGGKDLARRTRGTYELAPAEGRRTLVTFTNEVWPSSRVDALGAPLAKAYLRRNNAKALERLQQLIAGRATAAA